MGIKGTGRQTNMELCRIIAMLLVVTVHSGFATFGNASKFDGTYWGIIMMQSFAIVGVNLFVLITGYFSVSFKLRSIAKLVWACFFYALIALVVNLLLGRSVVLKNAFWVSNSIWYIGTYIGLLCFSPILNACIEKMDKTQHGILIIVLLIFQTWYEYIPRLIHDFHSGYSILSFMILYLIARYVRLYDFPSFIKKYDIWIYIVCSLCIAACMTSSVVFRVYPQWAASLLFKYNRPLVILSSLGLFAFFALREMRYNKVVNYIALSCIGVLLLHTSPFFHEYVAGLFRNLFVSYSGVILVVIWMGVISSEFAIAVLVDQVRIFIERKWLNKLFSHITFEIG